MTFEHGTYAATVAPRAESAVKTDGVLCAVGGSKTSVSGWRVVHSIEEYKNIFGWEGDFNYTLEEVVSAAFGGADGKLDKIAVLSVGTTAGEDFANFKAALTGDAFADLYQSFNLIPDIVVCPVADQDEDVLAALLAATTKIAGLWDATCVVSSEGDDISDIIENKATGNKRLVLVNGSLDVGSDTYHGAVLYACRQMVVDAGNDGIPYEAASNKVFTAKSFAEKYTREQANQLNEAGINSFIVFNGAIRSWGTYTSMFGSSSVPADEVFYTTPRMLEYIKRWFMVNNFDRIDRPMTRSLKDSILFSTQGFLDRLAARGALVGRPTVSFEEADNSTNDMMQGHFVFSCQVTPTAPLVSAKLNVAYTDEGFSVFFE